ncbi:MAG: BatD family protein [Acidobacteriota bacterium]
MRPLLLALALSLAALPLHADEPKIQVGVEPRSIGADETTVLSIELHSGGLGGLSANPQFQLDNLRIVGGPYQSESFQFVNGDASRSLTLRWQLAPLHEGAARVYAIRVQVGDQTYQIPDQHLQVSAAGTGGGAAAAPPPSGLGAQQDPFDEMFDEMFPGRQRRAPAVQPKLFLRAELEPQSATVGQQVLYTLYLYTQADVSAVSPQAIPTFAGFWSRDVALPQHPQAEMTTIDGERYGRVALLRKALFPLRSGRLTIDAAKVSLAVRVPQSGPFGLVPQVTEVQRAADPLTIDVAPLPPAPAGFTGLVGPLQVEAKIDPEEIHAGEAATLKLTFAGRGNLQSLGDPPPPQLDGVRVFPPQRGSSEDVQADGVESRRTWSYVLVPERPGSWALPPIEVPYFDPATHTYAVAQGPSVDLSALPAVQAAAPIPPAPTPAAIASQPPASSSPAPGGSAAAAGRATLTAVAAGAGTLALLGVGVGFALRRRPGAAPRRRLRERLARAGHEERPRQAASEIEEAWREYLQARWSVPAGAPSGQWPDLLARQGADPEAARELAALADDLHYLRYAPQLSSAEALREEVRRRSRELLRDLE